MAKKEETKLKLAKTAAKAREGRAATAKKNRLQCYDIICNSLEGLNSRSAACRAAGIQTTTFYTWLKEDPEFADRVAAAEERPVQVAIKVLLQCAIKALEDPRYQTSLIFLLKTKGGFDDGSGTKDKESPEHIATRVRQALHQARSSIQGTLTPMVQPAAETAGNGNGSNGRH